MLVVVQVALAVILLISSGLMIRTFHALTTVDPGFAAPEQLQTFRVNIPDTDVKDPEQVVRVEEDVLRKIEAVPGVLSVGLSMSVPMDGNGWEDTVFAKDRRYSLGELPIHRFRFVAPGFFETLGTPLVAGRDLTWGDIYNKVPVAIVSEKVARENWHDPVLALGKQIRANAKDDWREVVGVVRDVHDDGVDKEAPSSVYWPILAVHFTGTEFDVRRYVTYSMRSRRAGSEAFMSEVRRAVWSVDPNLPLADVTAVAHRDMCSLLTSRLTAKHGEGSQNMQVAPNPHRTWRPLDPVPPTVWPQEMISRLVLIDLSTGYTTMFHLFWSVRFPTCSSFCSQDSDPRSAILRQESGLIQQW